MSCSLTINSLRLKIVSTHFKLEIYFLQQKFGQKAKPSDEMDSPLLKGLGLIDTPGTRILGFFDLAKLSNTYFYPLNSTCLVLNHFFFTSKGFSITKLNTNPTYSPALQNKNGVTLCLLNAPS